MELSDEILVSPVESRQVTFVSSDDEVAAIPGVVNGVRSKFIKLEVKVLYRMIQIDDHKHRTERKYPPPLLLPAPRRVIACMINQRR